MSPMSTRLEKRTPAQAQALPAWLRRQAITELSTERLEDLFEHQDQAPVARSYGCG